ncbi:hypothetical protein JOM56_009620, partial [Amanita muscaria]
MKVTNASSRKRKNSEEVDIQRKRPLVDRVIEDVREAQSRKAADGDGPGISNISTPPSQVPLVIPESPSMNHGTGDAQIREAGDPVDSELTTRTETTIAIESPSMTLFQGSSNFQISNTNISAIGGNATMIRFGEHNPNISIPAQASTTPRPQPVDHFPGVEGHPGVPVPPRGPPTTSEPQTLADRDAPKAARDSEVGIMITSPAINPSHLQRRDEDDN